MKNMRCCSHLQDNVVKLHHTPVFLRESFSPAYLSGYADGEGCFCVSVNKSVKHKFGWEIRPSFSVSQNKDRAEVLTLFKNYLGCGNIRPSISDNTLKYEVRSLADLINKVIPHFHKYPLISGKRQSFYSFEKVCQLMQDKKHLTKDGLGEILVLAAKMNTSGKRKYVLRNKDIVSATSDSGTT
jgi:hypothetical protein